MSSVWRMMRGVDDVTQMTKNEQLGLLAGAVGVAVGLKRVYRVKRWTVPAPVWLAVTAGLTYAGWRGYKALRP